MPENPSKRRRRWRAPRRDHGALPDRFEAGIYFIGRIRTPWTRREDCPHNARDSDGLSAALRSIRAGRPRCAGVETCSHLVVLYWMDQSRRDLAVQVPRHLWRGPRHLLPCARPARPNPIAMSVVALKEVRGGTLFVTGLDCLDGTALIDIKPYFAIGSIACRMPWFGWHRDRK
jgi:tRNA-Thr(GGU) m(6)t(6)A37 methyltransferase TsaA